MVSDYLVLREIFSPSKGDLIWALVSDDVLLYTISIDDATAGKRDGGSSGGRRTKCGRREEEEEEGRG
jgi:hypothetical protein